MVSRISHTYKVNSKIFKIISKKGTRIAAIPDISVNLMDNGIGGTNDTKFRFQILFMVNSNFFKFACLCHLYKKHVKNMWPLDGINVPTRNICIKNIFKKRGLVAFVTLLISFMCYFKAYGRRRVYWISYFLTWQKHVT